jgi:MscS family membrane protein
MRHSRYAKLSFLISPVVVLIAGAALQAQGITGILGNGKSPTPTSSAGTDRLQRTTPRSAIYHFLAAYHEDHLQLASQYLDLRNLRPSQRTTQGPELARQLADLLDRDPRFALSQLSDDPEGRPGDGLAPNRDLLFKVQVNGQTIPLEMERVTQQDATVWLVSADTLARLPELDVLAGESAIEKRLPAFFVKTKILGTPLWVWIALVSLALLISLFSRLLSRLFLAITTPFLKRYVKWLQPARLAAFLEPLRLLLSVALFRALMELAAPSALLRDALLKLLTLLFALGAAALVMRIVDVISDNMLTRLSSHDRTLSYSVLPLGVRFVKVCIFCVALLFTLTSWGYNTNAILAGLGVGGLAVALAAQKTIENLFGGISIITDRPVLVGDFCKFGDQVGTVQDIGLRSTRIRTLERTVVTIPNSSFSAMTLENYSRRDRMWFHPTLRLRRDLTPAQVQAMMDAVTQILEKHPMVDAAGIPLRFTKISDQSLDLEIFAYVNSSDFDDYLKVQTQLLLSFLQASIDLQIGFAVPFNEALTFTPESGRKGGTPLPPDGALRATPQQPG